MVCTCTEVKWALWCCGACEGSKQRGLQLGNANQEHELTTGAQPYQSPLALTYPSASGNNIKQPRARNPDGSVTGAAQNPKAARDDASSSAPVHREDSRGGSGRSVFGSESSAREKALNEVLTAFQRQPEGGSNAATSFASTRLAPTSKSGGTGYSDRTNSRRGGHDRRWDGGNDGGSEGC